MISPDLAASPPGPAPAPTRDPARRADAPAPERAFEAFVETDPEQAPEAGSDAEAAPPDLAALAEVALPVLPPAIAVVAAFVAPPATVPDGEEAAPDQVPAAPPVGAAPIAPAAATPVAQTPAAPPPAPTAIATPFAPAPAADAEPEAEAEPDAAPRGPVGAAQPSNPASLADLRPVAAAPTAAPAAFDFAAQPAAAQSWRLSAVAAEAAQDARAPSQSASPSPRDVAAQITVAIAQSSQPQLEIRLDPPELGRVQIRLNPSEHGMQALVLADRPETQDFLRRHAEVLVRDLTEAGYASVSLNFAAGGEAAPRDAPAEERRLAPMFAAPAAQLPAREPAPRVAAAGLDIRL